MDFGYSTLSDQDNGLGSLLQTPPSEVLSTAGPGSMRAIVEAELGRDAIKDCM